MLTKTYNYPKNGPTKYSVKVAADGAIKVQPNDWLCKYSMAIHGRGDWVYEYARRLHNRMVPIQDSETINIGETIYHLPTYEASQNRMRRSNPVMDFSNGPAFTVSKSKPATDLDQIRLAERYLEREAGLPLSKTKLLGPILLSMNAGGRAVTFLAWETVQVVTLSTATAGVVAISAPFIALASAAYGLYTVLNTRNNIVETLGYCYGMTAWVYGATTLPTFSEKVAGKYRNILESEKPALIPAWNKGALAGWNKVQQDIARMTVNGRPVSPWAFRVYMRLISDNRPGLFCKRLAYTIIEKLNERKAVKDGVKNLIDDGCVYNA